MKILFDIGNTHSVIGFKINENFKTFRIGTSNIQTEDELYSTLSNLLKHEKIKIQDIESMGIASVVPEKNYTVEKLGEKYFKCKSYFIKPINGIYNIQWKVEYPKEIGADRVANVIAAKNEFGKDVIIVDFGTAVTVDIVNNGNFEGGAILPGIRTSMLSLFSKTAKLPQVELKVPKTVIGKNTAQNIQIGVIKTMIFGIERLIREIEKETTTNYKIITTGGMARSLINHSYVFDNYDPYLTLKGVEYFINFNLNL